MDKITVLVIDEQAVFRADMRQMLSQQPDLKVLDCDLAEDPLGIIEANLPDVVLLSSDLTILNALELSREITRCYRNTKVIVLSSDPNDEELFEVIKSAAVAYHSKNTDAEELGNTIRWAYRGEFPINDSLMTRPAVAGYVLKQFQEIASIAEAMGHTVAPLTHRERQILICVTNHITARQIAYTLRMSEQRVRNDISAILRKLIANDRARAVALSMQNGSISAEGKYAGIA